MSEDILTPTDDYGSTDNLQSLKQYVLMHVPIDLLWKKRIPLKFRNTPVEEDIEYEKIRNPLQLLDFYETRMSALKFRVSSALNWGELSITMLEMLSLQSCFEKGLIQYYGVPARPEDVKADTWISTGKIRKEIIQSGDVAPTESLFTQCPELFRELSRITRLMKVRANIDRAS